MLVFLVTGVTLACFRQHGTTPDAMEKLMSCVRNGTRLSLTSFNSRVGKGSSTHDVLDGLMRKLSMSDVVAVGNNSSRDTQGAGWWYVVKDEVSVEWDRNATRIVSIFAEKKVENLVASSWMLLLTGR